MRNHCRVVITDKCNLSCDFCCMDDREIFCSFKNQTAENLAKLRYDEVCVTGGEPMMAFKKLVQFVCMVKYYNPDAKVYLYTNGELLHTEEAATLKTAGVTGINWSPHRKPTMDDKQKWTFIHVCLIPVRILCDSRIADDDLREYAKQDCIELVEWVEGDCYDMPEEDRFRIL